MNNGHRQNFNFTNRPGFSHLDALIVVVVVAVGMAFLLAFIGGNSKGKHKHMRKPSQMRGMHQSMVIYAQNNNTYLPGLDSSGNILPPTAPAFSKVPNNALAGGSMAARYYILLENSFIAPDLMINPQESLKKWSTDKAMPATDQFSYALLRIASAADTTDIGNQAGRIVEWRDNANSQAILISDRNTASAATSSAVRSVWSTTTGTQADWKGNVVWGDNHAEFLNAPNGRLGPLSLNTKYGATINTNDFLFSEQDMPGKVGSASAMFGYTHDNF
jgi:hypothetical protein